MVAWRRLICALCSVLGVMTTSIPLSEAADGSSIDVLYEAAAIRGSSGQVLRSADFGNVQAVVTIDDLGTYTVLDVVGAPHRIAYLLAGDLLSEGSSATSATAWIPGDAATAQSAPFAVAAAAGCSHWLAGPFISYGYVVADSATNCSTAPLYLTNGVNIGANYSNTSLWFDYDATVLTSHLASRATKLCNGLAYTPYRGVSSWSTDQASGGLSSSWRTLACGL
jgi:hypothetical protein